METEQLFTGSKWELLQELSRKPQSTSELAKRIGTSKANVSQQLRQLEFAGLLERRRTRRDGMHFVYEIGRDYLYMVHLTPTSANKRTLKQEPFQRFLAGLLLHRHGLALMTFVLAQPETFKKLGAVGVLERDQPELFVITEHVDEVRQKHANIEVTTIDGTHKVAIWSHTKEEVEKGMRLNEPYFAHAIEQVSITYDPEGILSELKKKHEEP